MRSRVSRRASVESARSISAAGSSCLGAAKASPTPVASTVRRSGFSGSSQASTKATAAIGAQTRKTVLSASA